MSALHLELLGRPVVRRDGSAPIPVPSSLQAFIAFLGVEPGSGCHRDRMIDALWPEVTADLGRRRVNTAVWRLRNLFGGEREAIVATRSGHIALDRAVVSIDLAPTISALSDAGRAAARSGQSVAIDELSQAVLVDAEQFLVGNYEEWVVQTRHQLELAVVKGVETLLEVTSAPQQAIALAELLIRLDPLREDAHRRLIRLYADEGRRADALRQYEVCARYLRDNLGVEPLLETTLAVAAIREGVAPIPVDPSDPHGALRALRDALVSCEAIVDQIESALSTLSPGRDV